MSIAAVDSDVPANTLIYSAAGLPPGLAINSGTGQITGTIGYTANASSPYTATVSVIDNGSPNGTGQTTFGWTVGDTNRNPIGSDDAGTVAEDSVRVFNVLGNDMDPDGDPLSIAGLGAPSHGSAQVAAGGISYLPNPNYNGPDSVSYSLSDGRGGMDVATLHITVTPVNDAPTIAPISNRTGGEQQLISFTASASDIENDSVAFSLSGAPAGSAMTSGGVFTWTPSESQGPGGYSFNVVATDNGTPSLSGLRQVTITVTEVNAAPVVVNPGYQVSSENDNVTLDIMASDSDIPANTLHYTASGLPPGLSIDAASGRITGTLPFDAAARSPYAVTVTAGDSGSPQRSTATTFTWRVDNTNRAPVATDLHLEADAGVPISLVLAGSDPDGDAISYSLQNEPAKGSLSGGPRAYVYTPDVTAAGTDTFAYRVSDGDLSATGTVTVTITPNYAPVGDADGYVVRRGGVLTIEAPGVLTNDHDYEGAALTAVVQSSPTHGTLSLGDGGSFRYEHDGSAGDLDGFEYRVDDGMRQSEPIAVQIAIEENVAPTAVGDVVVLDEDTTAVFRPLNNDSDPNNEPVQIVGVGDPEHGSVTWNTGSVFTYKPERDYNGVDSFIYEITDGDLTGSAEVKLTINPVNDAPLAHDAAVVGRSGSTLTVDLDDFAADIDGDQLSYLLEAPPSSTVQQVSAGVFVFDLHGVVKDVPALAYVATDPAGVRATALLRVAVEIPAELVGIPSLVSDHVSVGSVFGGDGDGSHGRTSVVVGLRLMIGSVLGTFLALRLPSFVLLLLLVASLYLGFSRRFVFSSAPTALPLVDKKRVDIVMAPSQAGVPVREEAGAHQRVIHRFREDEKGIITTGARTMVRSEVWVEVETPEGDGWVYSEFITEQVPEVVFREDHRTHGVVADLVDRIYGSEDLLPITAGHDLHVALYGPPVRFSANSLKRLLLGASVYWWWNWTGDAPTTQNTFAEEVGESVAAAYRNRDAHFLEHQYPVPIEFANMHSLVVGNEEHAESWRIFFRYEKDEPSIAGLMREAAPNPAAMHGMPVRVPV